jgi:hypothetical protein
VYNNETLYILNIKTNLELTTNIPFYKEQCKLYEFVIPKTNVPQPAAIYSQNPRHSTYEPY